MKNKKVYRLWNKKENKYISSSRGDKSKWNTIIWTYRCFINKFKYSPKELIDHEMENYEIHEYELVWVYKHSMKNVHDAQQEKKHQKESKLKEIESVKEEIKALVNSDHLNFPVYTIVSMYNQKLFRDDMREKLKPLVENLRMLEKNL